ncbi:phosphotransferase [Aeropyrum camini]|uniref:Aminoglycoside phosphotransferase domain-containing protein n=1 Tax=Aeropyrum camini SY1 = JCM 12091 TaxID=1198449 RepID=U3TFU8_9CREN|nr:phosphotransferase [Aeropyrum camini]BAN90915.1 hypothetical protein ACAM_1446 [Aeropyrum camini SY1 = JCM 12091]
MYSKPWYWGCRGIACSDAGGGFTIITGVECDEPLAAIAHRGRVDAESGREVMEALLRGGAGLDVECIHPIVSVEEVSLESAGPRSMSYRLLSRPYGLLLAKVYRRPPPVDREWLLLRTLARYGLPLAPRPLCRASLEGRPYMVIHEYVEGVPAATLFIEAAKQSLKTGVAAVPSEAGSLGVAVAAIHANLASCRESWCKPEEPAEALVERWKRRLASRAAMIEDLASGLPAEEARIIAEAASALRQLYRREWRGLRGGVAMQIHGDLHLYQVLVSRSGRIVVTDFEGEPSRQPAGAMEKEHPERDLAALLRSLDYASVLAAQALEGKTVDAAIEKARGELGGWVEASYRVIEASYIDALSRAGFPGEVARERLAFWLVERASYETVYELKYRTGYHLIPATALLEAVEGGMDWLER